MSAELVASTVAETVPDAPGAEHAATPRSAPGQEEAFGTPWERALAAIESATAEAEVLVAPGFLLEGAQVPAIGLWAPPDDLGPLPAEHEARVLAILDRQEGLTLRVEEAARAARTHLRAVGSMQTNNSSISVYVDAIG